MRSKTVGTDMCSGTGIINKALEEVVSVWLWYRCYQCGSGTGGFRVALVQVVSVRLWYMWYL